MPVRWLKFALCVGLVLGLSIPPRGARTPRRHEALFGRENLVAWCIVPFDAKKRGPEERAEMLRRLGFRRFAYDWRAEHVPTFDAELEALKKNGIALDAFWCPAGLNPDSLRILDLLKRHKLHTQLWVMMGDPAPQSKDQAEKVAAAVRTLGPLADEAARIGCSVGLYNHGGWFGEPENEIAIIKELKRPNVGIVYNLHHGHDHLDRFPALMQLMKPYLYAVNINGMVRDGERAGKKILPLFGQGDLDLGLLKTIRDSDYRGPIGILGHTQDDAEARSSARQPRRPRLAGWLQLGRQAPRSETPAAHLCRTAPGKGLGRRGAAGIPHAAADRGVSATLAGPENYNILVASDTKQSGAHWELFTMAGAGTLSAYLPGMRPDHVHSKAAICDGKPHDLAMQYEGVACDSTPTASSWPTRRLSLKGKPRSPAASPSAGWWKAGSVATAPSITSA